MRISFSPHLADSSKSISFGLNLPPGQQADIYGPQLEAQLAPSQYRATGQQGGVYTNAHWAIAHLPVIATAPGLFSTAFSIEASL